MLAIPLDHNDNVMTGISNPHLKHTVDNYFANQGEEAPSWVETHGLLCAFTVGPYDGPADFGLALEMSLPEAVSGALDELRGRLLTNTLGGERISLPCLLDPYREEDGADLASWCAGFLSGMLLHEERWHNDQTDDPMSTWLLPMLLISGIDDDPALDEVWNDSRLVRQMANGIPDVLEEMLLHFQGPDGPQG